MTTQALVPNLLKRSFTFTNSGTQAMAWPLPIGFIREGLAVLSGVALVTMLAQVMIPLPWTPVPITGQTFGVALLALLWGSKRAFSAMAVYLSLSFMGLPVLAGAKAFLFSPTTGYLAGMLIASYVVGQLSDRGFAKNFKSAFLSAVVGSLITFSCGLLVLSQFVPVGGLVMAGLLPFLPGDLVKNLLASYLVSRANKLYSA